MYTLIAFATQWGSKLGGINSFNTDFLSAFGVAYHLSARVICIVASATDEEIRDALNAHVRLVPLPYPPKEKRFTQAQAQVSIDEIKRLDINFDTANTVWLGHDLITGAAANEAAMIAGGRSAIIHHMSYNHYESFAENSATANEKIQIQTTLFQQADLVFAVGPLLRDALSDLLGGSKEVSMLIPGLAEIDLRPTPKTFTAFLSGRLSDNAAKIKQGHLGIAAFALAHREARKTGMPDGLCRQPKLILRGVDFESQQTPLLNSCHENPETALKRFAEEYADAVINLHALPYTLDRQILYKDLSGSSVALMPSWHEGFGLVAWEAIAAGVPLIVSKNSGVYHLLEEIFPGDGTGCVTPVDIQGAVDMPFFRQEDLKVVVDALTAIANNPATARRKAGRLRSILENYTWSACAEQAALAFHWTLQKGSISLDISTMGATTPSLPPPQNKAAASAVIFPLQMPAKQWRAGSGIADSQLLRAEEAQVPFDPARHPELQDAHNWLDAAQWPQAVRLITGAGGLGKTRLALELCQQRLDKGWQAGFLDNDCNADTMASGWECLRDLAKPLLIVIDYAETRQPVLLALIKAMLKNPGDQPVRVLLLARNGGEWWDNLPGQDSYCEALLSGYATSGPFCLPPLYLAANDRSEAYQKALHTFAQTLNVVAPNVVPEMSGEHFGRPLYLQMAALLALHGERPTTAEGLTKALLNHERRYWRGLLVNFNFVNPEHYAQQLLALATLAGGFDTPGHAKPYWITASGNSGPAEDVDVLFNALVPLYPGKQGLQSVRPDLLGEALVGQSLLRTGADRLLDAVLNDSATQVVRRHALTVLSRLSSQRPDLHEILTEALVRYFVHCYRDILTVAIETAGDLPLLAEAAFSRLPSATQSQLAGLLEPLLREESVQLSGLACAVSGFLVEKTGRKFLKKKKDINSLADYAGTLINYSVDLHRAGRSAQALTCALKAFKLFKQLYDKNRQRFAPDYAMSLNNIGSHLSDAGKYEEALTHAEQALDIYQRLARNNPGRYEPKYAGALHNVGSHLSDAGKYEEALTHAKQALDIYQRLARNNPDHYEPDYAMSLHNVGTHLSDAGKYEEALTNAKQALDIYQRLTQNNLDRYEPKYAGALHNVANRLNNAGKYEEALTNAEQALDIYQRLARNNPDRYEPDYAMSLHNVGSHLSDAGKYEEALTNAEQALDIYQRLAQNNPDRYEPNYADGLHNVANGLSNAGKYEEALTNAEQALDIYQRLAQNNPDRYEPDYAMLLRNFGSHLSDAGKYEEALANAEQALDIYQRLAIKYPERFEVDRFSCTCETFFLGWLANPMDKEGNPTDLPELPATALPHQYRELQLYKNFVQACCFSDKTTRTDGFKQVITGWRELSLAAQSSTQNDWLCATAWGATFAPETIQEIDWQANWEKFKNQRQGCIPSWMQETAQRLSFRWPQ